MSRCICKSSVVLLIVCLGIFRFEASSGTGRKTHSGAHAIRYGLASFYHASLNGLRTFNGEHYRNEKLTAAHKTLPMGTVVRITDLRNHKSVIVRINDRLPQNSKRMIDLSQSAARQLHLIARGLGHVKMEVLPKRNYTLAAL